MPLPLVGVAARLLAAAAAKRAAKKKAKPMATKDPKRDVRDMRDRAEARRRAEASPVAKKPEGSHSTTSERRIHTYEQAIRGAKAPTNKIYSPPNKKPRKPMATRNK